jgi:hypothetical protein
VSVALAVLWLGFVPKHCEAVQRVGSGSYLCWRSTTAPPLVTRTDNGNLGQVTNTPSFSFAPAQVQRQSPDTVERVLSVSNTECRNVLLVLGALFGWRAVVGRTVDTQGASKSLSPSWLDFFQDS